MLNDAAITSSHHWIYVDFRFIDVVSKSRSSHLQSHVYSLSTVMILLWSLIQLSVNLCRFHFFIILHLRFTWRLIMPHKKLSPLSNNLALSSRIFLNGINRFIVLFVMPHGCFIFWVYWRKMELRLMICFWSQKFTFIQGLNLEHLCGLRALLLLKPNVLNTFRREHNAWLLFWTSCPVVNFWTLLMLSHLLTGWT